MCAVLFNCVKDLSVFLNCQIKVFSISLREYSECPTSLWYWLIRLLVCFSLSLRERRLDVVKCLVEDHHCDVNVTDKEGSTPLHISCR